MSSQIRHARDLAKTNHIHTVHNEEKTFLIFMMIEILKSISTKYTQVLKLSLQTFDRWQYCVKSKDLWDLKWINFWLHGVVIARRQTRHQHLFHIFYLHSLLLRRKYILMSFHYFLAIVWYVFPIDRLYNFVRLPKGSRILS